MSLASEMLVAGETLLGEVLATYSGTITPRGGSSGAFSGARIVRRPSSPSGIEQEHDEIDVRIPATGYSGTPARDSSVAITGISGTWYCHVVSRFAPGGVVVAWDLNLKRITTSGVLQSWAPGSTGG